MRALPGGVFFEGLAALLDVLTKPFYGAAGTGGQSGKNENTGESGNDKFFHDRSEVWEEDELYFG